MHDHSDHDRSSQYKKNSLSLWGAVSMGTGVMIGAGIFALAGQVAELAREWFPLAFLVAAIIAGFSAYSYVKMANAWPSAGGIAMFLQKSYGRGTVTAVCALLMYFSMVVNESLVARTFATYSLHLTGNESGGWLLPVLAVAVLVFAFLVNILGNKTIQTFSFFMAFIKIGGLVFLAAGGLWASGLSFEAAASSGEETSFAGFLGAVALGIHAYKGFTTITNSGSEIKNPKKNVGRAIIVSLVICTVIYLLVSLAVAGNLTVDEIVAARDYSLAEAARPAYGELGQRVTAIFAIVATVSGLIASVFAVSRMLAMLTEMKLVPHSHFGMPGSVQKHTLVYTIVLAILLAVFFDLSRIASLGAIFYILMDIAIHWGIFRNVRKEIGANPVILVAAMAFDVIVLGAFIWVKIQSDIVVIYASIIGLVLIILGEYWFLRSHESQEQH
ncbi:MAG: APC family permease [Pseudohongiella sp.]|nr:APC family permease [Pseudohongiella sp.]